MITPASATATTDSSITFEAVGYSGSGQEDPLAVTWSVTGGIGTIDTTGLFDPTTVGSGSVIATKDGVYDTALVTVTRGAVDSLAVFPADTSVTADDTIPYGAKAWDRDGNMFTPSPVAWSEPTGLGSIDAGGVYTPGSAGAALIVAVSEGIADSAGATITAGALASVTVTPGSASLSSDSSLTFTAAGADAKGNPVPIVPAWNVTGGIGTITAGGLFDPITVGSGSIIATTGSFSDSSSVIVTAGAVSTLILTPSDTTISADDSLSFAASAFDADMNPFTPVVAWSEPTGLGTIDGTGLFVPTVVGTTYVIGSSGDVADSARVIIVHGALATVTVDPASATLTADSALSFSAAGFDSKENTVAISPTWDVGGGIGSIDIDGLFDATTVGSGSVNATASGITGSSSVTVSHGALVALTLTPASATIPFGDSLQYTASGMDGDGNSFTPAIDSWAEPVGIGVIDDAGLFVPGGSGAGIVTARSGAISDTASFTVVPGTLDSIVVSPADTTVTADQSVNYTAVGYFAGGTSAPVSPAWSVSGGVGTIDGAGLFSAGAVGSGKVIALSGSKRDTVAVTVTHGAVATLTVVPADTTITVDETVPYGATARDGDGNTFTVPISWSLSGTAGSIGDDGVFDPSAPGSGTVKGSAEGVTGSATVSVTSGALASIVVNPSSATVNADSTRTFTATGYDTGGFPVIVSPTWSVAGGIGSVSGSGVFDAGAVGSGFVIATSGALSDSSMVTVTRGAADSLAILPTDTTITADDIITLTYELFDADGNAFTSIVTWTIVSGDGSISSEGVFSPHTAGVVLVEGETENVRDTVSITVLNGTVASLEVVPHTDTTDIEGSITFTAIARDGEDNPISGVTGLAWSGGDAIGTIDGASGLFDPTVPGVDSVTVTLGNISGRSGPIVVTAGPARSITITPTAAILALDADTTFTVVTVDGEGNVTGDAVSWSTTGAIGSISGSGLFSATAPGGGSVIATAGDVSDTVSVTVLGGGDLVLLAVVEDRDVVRRGETGIPVSLVVRNDGTENVHSVAGALRFTSDGTNVSGDYSYAAARIAAHDIAPGATDTLDFLVTVSDSASIGSTVVIDGSVSGTEEGNTDPVGDLDAGSLGGWRVGGSPLIEDVARSLYPGETRPGDAAAFLITLRNRGSAAVLLEGGTVFRFTDGDRIFSAPLVSPVNLQANGKTTTLYFDSGAVPSDFDPGTWPLTIDMTGEDEFGLPYAAPFNALHNSVEIVPPYIHAEARFIPGSIVHPGTDSLPLLRLDLVNLWEQARTLSSVEVTNTTAGEGSAAQFDSTWRLLRLVRDTDGDGEWDYGETVLDSTSFSSNTALFDDLSLEIAEAETVSVLVCGDVSLFSAPDGEQLDIAIDSANAIRFDDTTSVFGSFPLDSPGSHFVDGVIAAQIGMSSEFVHNLPAGADDSLALIIDYPSDGYLLDTLQTLMIENLGDAEAGGDISEMKLWADGGDGVFRGEGDDDTPLGALSWVGDLWSASRLDLPIPPGGRRLFATIDLSKDAEEGRSIRLSLPVDGAGVTSGNDGPVDSAVTATDLWIAQGADRIVITKLRGGFAGPVSPGDTSAALFRFLAANVYSDTAYLTGLSVANRSAGIAADSVARRVRLLAASRSDTVYDAPGGALLATARMIESAAVLSDFSLPIVPGEPCTLTVAVDVGLRCVADGDTVDAGILDGSSFNFLSSRQVVGSLHLSGSEDGRPVDGMAAAQVGLPSLTGGAVGPSENDRLVFRFVVPPNGCLDDTLTGIHFQTDGTLLPSEFDAMHLLSGGSSETAVGDLVWDGSSWVREGISIPVASAGETLSVRVDIATTAADGATFRLVIPEDGIAMASSNDGPIDRSVESPALFQVSTSPVFATLSTLPSQVSVGQVFDVEMTVVNHGYLNPTTIDSLTPGALVIEGDSVFILSSPDSTPVSLEPDESVVFRWTSTASAPGTAFFRGSAAGERPTGEAVQTLPAQSNTLRIQKTPESIHVEAVSTLPPSTTVGALDVSALVISLEHGDAGASDAASIRIDTIGLLLDDGEGKAIDPSGVVNSVRLIRTGEEIGTATARSDSTGALSIPLSTPVRLAPGSGVAINLLLDMSDTASVGRFRVVLASESVVRAVDANSGGTVPAEGDFPFVTEATDLYQPPSALEVDVANRFPDETNRGTTAVPMMNLTFTTEGTAGSTADITVTTLALFTGGGGFPFDSLRMVSGDIVRFSGNGWSARGDSIVFDLDPEITLPPSNVITLSVEGDLSPAAPIGTFRVNTVDVDPCSAASGEEILVALDMAPPPSTRIVARTDSIFASGADGDGSTSLFQGAAEIHPFDILLRHNGGDSLSAVLFRGLRLRLESDDGSSVDVRSIIDRIQLVRDGDAIASVSPSVDDVDTVTLAPESAVALEPGDSLLVGVEIDLKADAPGGYFRFVTEREGIDVVDRNDGEATSVRLGTDEKPYYATPLFHVVELSDRLTYAVDLELPALSTGGSIVDDAMTFRLFVPGGGEGSDLHLESLSLEVEGANGDDAEAARWLSGASAYAGGNDSAVAEGRMSGDLVVFDFEPSLPVAVGDTIEIVAALHIAEDAATEPFRIRFEDDHTEITEQIPFLDRADGDDGRNPSAYTYFSDKSFEKSLRNYPNPFSSALGKTTFAFYARGAGEARIAIFTGLGVPVVLLREPVAGSGVVEAVWDGRNGAGRRVINGGYLAVIEMRYEDGTSEKAVHKIAVLN